MSRGACLLAFCAAILMGTTPESRAETWHTCAGFVDTVPAVIDTPGIWCLRRDLASNLPSGAAITLAADDIVLDCNRFKIGGLGAGPGTAAAGVQAIDRYGITVRDCAIRGFAGGILIDGSPAAGKDGSHLVENNNLDGNRGVGIRVEGDGSLVRGNTVRNTAASPHADGTVGISVLFSVEVRDNIIDGVAGTVATGIRTYYSNGMTISRNRIGGLAPSSAGYGIHLDSSIAAQVVDNISVGDGSPNSVGVKCSGMGLAHGNIVLHYGAGIQGCQFIGNLP